MKERPILFSGPMVRALLDGTKTQTRRIVKGAENAARFVPGSPGKPGHWWHYFPAPRGSAVDIACPYGQPGDRLWVRETHTISSCGTAVYRADARDQRGDRWHSIEPGDPKKEVLWKPSIFCKREHSRITLEITGIRVERLQEITEEDAIAEGVSGANGALGSDLISVGHWVSKLGNPLSPATWPRARYGNLWESINGPGSWDANPFVWVVEFRRLIQ